MYVPTRLMKVLIDELNIHRMNTLLFFIFEYVQLIYMFFRTDLREMFYNTIDRIDIIKTYKRKVGRKLEKEKNFHERCYNAKKVGTAGLCQTDNGNWGFCSRSCITDKDLNDGEPYEEAVFQYFDEAPKGSSFSGSKAFNEFCISN